MIILLSICLGLIGWWQLITQHTMLSTIFFLGIIIFAILEKTAKAPTFIYLIYQNKKTQNRMNPYVAKQLNILKGLDFHEAYKGMCRDLREDCALFGAIIATIELLQMYQKSNHLFANLCIIIILVYFIWYLLYTRYQRKALDVKAIKLIEMLDTMKKFKSNKPHNDDEPPQTQ